MKSNTLGTKDWKLIEEIAALLEKALSPHAKVEHDVYLPVLGESRKRQCDIVIYGESPQEILAIAEVQSRKRKPEITMFHAWIEKMREVGAQQLICVSALGYPKSIKDQVVRKYGPTVKLLTLEELHSGNLPGLGFFKYIHRKPFFTIKAISNVKVSGQPTQVPEKPHPINLSTAQKIFQYEDDSAFLNLKDVVTKTLNERTIREAPNGQLTPDSYDLEIPFGPEDKLNIYINGQILKISNLMVKITVENQIHQIPLKYYAYKQEFVDDVLAWVASAKGIVEGEEVGIQMVFKPDENGLLQPVLMQPHGAISNTTVELFYYNAQE